MSRMIPPSIHPDVKSQAEKKIFRLFKNAENTEDWVVLHSLGLARHQKKRRGEVDFLVLCGRGIFVLEVKGGRIKRVEGVWQTINRYGSVNELHESPYDQASSAMFALEKDIRNEFSSDSRLRKLVFGYGVMCPNTPETGLPFGSEGDRSVTYTLEDTRLPVASYIGRVANFIEDRAQGKKLRPRQEDIEKILRYLRGDFDCIPPLWIKAEETSSELLELTREQYAVLDTCARRERLICRGAAGTGKTVLAMREAINSARDGSRILLLCYNRNLADALSRSLSREEDLANLKVDSIYRYMHSLISGSSFQAEFLESREGCNEDELYARIYPYYATLASMDIEPWDQIIIDEGQDFMTAEVLDFLDACVAGGLECGKWRWFMDDNNQAGVYGHYDPASCERLERFGVAQLLTINCRNTRQIHEETLMLVNPDVGAVAKVDGLPVRYAWFRDAKGQTKAMERQLERLKREGISSSNIIILSARSIDQCIAGGCNKTLVKPFDVSDQDARNNGPVPYTTVSAFKGLESPIVIFTDIDEIEGSWWSSVLYVGMSRARVELIMLLPEKLRALYERHLKEAMSGLGDDED